MTILIVLFAIFWYVSYSSLSARIKTLEDRLKSQSLPLVGDVPNETKPVEAASAMAPTSATDGSKEGDVSVVLSAPIKKQRDADYESRVGGKVFTAVGIIATLFGVGFFLRYAFEHDLISPPFRVAIGFFGAAVAVVLGDWLRKKYEAYGQSLIGLGLGIAYLSWYASLHFYQLMSSPAVFIGMMVVTAAGLLLAVRLKSKPLFIFTQIGGFLTPFLVGGTENPYLVLFPYVLVLDLAVLLLAFLKTWREPALVAMIGSAATFFAWYGPYERSTPWVFPFIFTTVYAALFAFASLKRYMDRRALMDGFDLFTLILNPSLYGIAAYAIIPRAYDAWTGLWFGFIGAACLAIALAINGKDEQDLRYQNALAIIGSVFLALAVPIACDGVMQALVWALVATALIGCGYVIRSQPLLAVALLMSFVATVSLFGDLGHTRKGITLWFNVLFLERLLVVASFAAAAGIHWWKAATLGAINSKNRFFHLTPADLRAMMSIALVEAYIAIIFVLLAELGLGHYSYRFCCAVVATVALIGAWFGGQLKSLGLRVAVYATFGICALAFAVPPPPVNAALAFNVHVAAGLWIIAMAFGCMTLFRAQFSDRLSESERRGVHAAFFVGIHSFAIFLASSEIARWYGSQIKAIQPPRVSSTTSMSSLIAARNAAISVYWTIHALALLIFGIFRRSVIARRFAFALFGATVIKVFFYDAYSFDNIYRTISFITLGVLLLVSGFLYQRYGEQIKRML